MANRFIRGLGFIAIFPMATAMDATQSSKDFEMFANDDCHLIRLHGPWQAVGGTDLSTGIEPTAGADGPIQKSGSAVAAVRFKVPGPVPAELSTLSTVILIRKWNRPPSGLTDRSKMFVIIDSCSEVLAVWVNQTELSLVPRDKAKTLCANLTGTMFTIPAEAVESFNELRIELDNHLQIAELQNVQLAISSSDGFSGS